MLQTCPQIWQPEQHDKNAHEKMNDRKSQKIELPQGINIKLPTSDFPIGWQFGVQAC